MRPVQCAPRGSSYAISHESQSCVLSLPVRLALLRVACWGDCVVCVVRGHEVTERGFRYGTRERRSSRAIQFGVKPVYLCFRISWSCLLYASQSTMA